MASSDGAAVVLESAIPILSVTDLPEALEYYGQVLGFEVGWTWGDPPDRASVCRDRVELNLSQATTGTAPRISKIYVQMTGVDAYSARVTTAGATIAVPLADRPYGMRDFRIVDPSGNELSFGEATRT